MIKLIKLTSGTEIVGEADLTATTHVTMLDPLQINYRQRADMSPPSVALHRFNPFANARQFNFKYTDIQSISDPLPGLVKYYGTSLKYIQEHVDHAINNELTEAAGVAEGSTEDDKIKRAMMEKMMFNPILN